MGRKERGKMKKTWLKILAPTLVVVFMLLMQVAPAIAQTTTNEQTPGPYSGDFWKRSTLTGDWGGARNEMAAKGVTMDLSVTQMYQGIVGGGKDQLWKYGGRGNLTTNVDTQKLGLWPGGFFTVEVEGNFDQSVNNKTGALMPVNSNQLYPHERVLKYVSGLIEIDRTE